MRALATMILALTTVGCAPAGFDLVPRETSASSLITPRWVGTESTQSSVSASYERAWLDHLLFEVEVVNQSDSMLVVDPRQFSLTLAISEGASKRVRPIAPVDPAGVKARLDRESGAGPGFVDALLGVGDLVVTSAVVAVFLAGGESPDLDPLEPGRNRLAIRRADASRARERLLETLLQRTELAPGQSVRGEIWFPARPLTRGLVPRSVEYPDGVGRITEAPDRRDVRRAITLRAPAALGGQEIDYFVWID